MKKKFQLCELPNEIILNVLATMQVVTAMTIAQCSTKCYNLVKSLNLKAEASIEDLSFIHVFTDNFDIYVILQEIALDTMLVGSVSANDASDEGDYIVIWKKPNNRVIDWIRFVLDLINEEFPLFRLVGNEYEPEWIQRTMDGVTQKQVLLERPWDDDRARSIIECFKAERMIFIVRNPYLNGQPVEVVQTSKILIGNYDSITLGHEFPMNLDLLLITNGKIIDMLNHNLSLKDVRIFLKSWMNGALPNLQYLSFRMNQNVNPDKLLHRIHHKEVAQGIKREKIFSCQSDPFLSGVNGSISVNGGFDIYKFNGQQVATVVLQNKRASCSFELIVWD